MKKTNQKSLKKTIGFAATFALLGASLGVDVGQVWAAQTAGDTAQPPGSPTRPGFSSKPQGAGVGANQLKFERGVGANQLKIDRGTGANQLKFEKGAKSKAAGSIGDGSVNGAAPANPGSTKMLNPQPLPPKQGKTGNAGLPAVQLPAVQK